MTSFITPMDAEGNYSCQMTRRDRPCARGRPEVCRQMRGSAASGVLCGGDALDYTTSRRRGSEIRP